MEGRPLNFDSILWFIDDIVGDFFGSWFRSDHFIKGKQQILHFRHNLGKNWSVFLGNFFGSAIKSILDIEVEHEEFEKAVTIRFEDKSSI